MSSYKWTQTKGWAVEEKHLWKIQKPTRHNRCSQGETQDADSASYPSAAPSPLCWVLLRYFLPPTLGAAIIEMKTLCCSCGERPQPSGGAGLLIPSACRAAQCAAECVSTMATVEELQEFDFHRAPGPCLNIFIVPPWNKYKTLQG